MIPLAQAALLVLLAVLQSDTLLVAKAAPKPQSKCAPGCTKHGTCNEELGRCDCPRGFSGPDCSTPPADIDAACRRSGVFMYKGIEGCSLNATSEIPCLNACNGRGRCLSGWCHCEPGFYGGDCSLSLDPATGQPQLLAGRGYAPRARRPWVYVYELPPAISTWYNVRRQDRPLTFLFWQRLLSAGARVADPAHADVFFVPVAARNTGESKVVVRAIKYIRATWPMWNATGGARHVFIHTGDSGRAEMLEDARYLTSKAILLTHWGLYQEYPPSGWKASHRPGQDVVVPIHISPIGSRGSVFTRSPLHPLSASSSGTDGSSTDGSAGASTGAARARDIQMLFAGRICGDGQPPRTDGRRSCNRRSGGYSQGVRQEVHYHHHNRSGFIVTHRDPQYQEHLARARFCLAPTGGGHGHRQILVSFAGCVPLLIGDYVLQPFEPELDWPRFSLSLPQAEIPVLHQKLAAVSDAELATMQAALPCAAQHMAWSSITGTFMQESGRYDAFETTLEVLRMRVQYPGVDPATYSQLDADYLSFMYCGQVPPAAAAKLLKNSQQGGGAGAGTAGGKAGAGSGAGAGLGSGGGKGAAGCAPATMYPEGSKATCSLSEFDGATCLKRCLGTERGKRIVPGGAVCCGVSDLAHCPRLWC